MSPRWVRPTRVALLGVGGVALVVGGWQLVAAQHVVDVGRWLVGALVLHDGVFAMFVVGLLLGGSAAAGALATRGVRAPRGAGVLLAAGLMVGGALTLVAWPEIHKKSLGTANPTVLPGDYATRLLGVWVAIVAVVAIGTLVLSVRARVRRTTARRGATPARDGAPPRTPDDRSS
ncbi:hypothetical protein [Luteimicrobium subarcticum]|uniref:Uncharacterized protein n=1 Tax=Luteimicrobium subarcticum TaxID=620910 RepID=A0A2M8W1T9_9MICO|nr:hypothetical protein [Luteimicrobium subarcticum]PJI84885.1 hypothetical protein CLV34_3132 [Luteimicrobium subarcticum]